MKDLAMRLKIEAIFAEMWLESNTGDPPCLTNESVLIDTGLDSMAYAVLVARLDEELGIDPFSDATEAFYPLNFGQFVEFYEKHGNPTYVKVQTS